MRVCRYAIPGFVFFAQNNLSFMALQHMSNSAFQLLLNMRIVAVALLTVIMIIPLCSSLLATFLSSKSFAQHRQRNALGRMLALSQISNHQLMCQI